MTLLPPTYDIGKSYEENFSAGPVYAGAIPPMPATGKTWSFLGFELSSPIGVPAGPLLDAVFEQLAVDIEQAFAPGALATLVGD